MLVDTLLGFSPGKETTDVFFTIRRNRVFIVLNKAFNRVSREVTGWL